ncbi:MAG: BatA domain-containing protein, partial [Gemmataceae bacterium]
MLPLFLYPLAFAGLVAVPALVGIYLFRNRFKRHPVSSLMLWIDARESREGGARLRTLQTPLLFLIELLVILALILGAADPHLRVSATARPVVVVLDDSFSMQAGGDDSPRARAEAALRKEFAERPPFSIRFVLAGERPQVLGDAARTPREAFLQLDGWRCTSSVGRLEPALAQAGEVGGELALLLVITDRAPAKGTVADTGRVRWWAHGTPRGNVAITSAGRTARDGPDRCLIEVTNLSEDDEARTLDVTRLETGAALERIRLT